MNQFKAIGVISRRQLAGMLIAFLSLGIFVYGADRVAPVRTTRGVAIDGYDTVAYFTDSRPVRGNTAFTHSWMGAAWRFASAEHRDMFAAHPEQYAPQYGGYCAYGVSENHAVSIDPEAWKIIDGKLYLNYSKSVRTDFLKEPARRIQLADKNWPGLHR